MNRVLLVDDDRAVVFGYRTEMEIEGLKVDSAYTLDDAEQFIRAHIYRAVITDLNLSGKMDLEGIKVVKSVRQHQPESVIIAVTGISDEDVKKRVLDAGARHYLEKPVEARSIIKLI
ncbi:response regulator [Fibrobacterota bacterium]